MDVRLQKEIHFPPLSVDSASLSGFLPLPCRPQDFNRLKTLKLRLKKKIEMKYLDNTAGKIEGLDAV